MGYNTDYVASQYHSGTGTTDAFHQLLIDYVFEASAPGGVYVAGAALGIGEYLLSRNIAAALASNSYSFNISNGINAAISHLRNGRPIVGAMATIHDAPENHSVLIYGVTYDSANPTSSETMYTAHWGQGVNTVNYARQQANAIWFYEYGYIQCGKRTCSPSSAWKYYSPLTHYTYCECGKFLSESHRLNSSNYCTVCNTTIDNSDALE